jgi:hypothetical protein
MTGKNGVTGALRGKRRKAAVALACAVSVIGIAACGGGDDDSSSSGGTVTYGANTELSGPLQITACRPSRAWRLRPTTSTRTAVSRPATRPSTRR